MAFWIRHQSLPRLRHYSKRFVILAIVSAFFLAIQDSYGASSDGGSSVGGKEVRSAANVGVDLDPGGTDITAGEKQWDTPAIDVVEKTSDVAAGVSKNPDTSQARPKLAKRSANRRRAVNSEVGKPKSNSSDFWGLVRSGGALVVVLALVVVAYWLVRRFVPSVGVANSRVLRIVARANLTPKHHIALVQISDRLIMVGHAGDSISALTEITDQAQVAEILSRAETSTPARKTLFGTLLAKEENQFNSKQDLFSTRNEAADHSSSAMEPVMNRDTASKPMSDLLQKLKAMQSS